MKPYYQNNGVTLYHGKAEDVLPSVTADLLVTDPPYGMNFLSGQRKVRVHGRIANDDVFPIETIKLAISRVTRAAYVFCRWDNIYDMPKPKSFLVWDKGRVGSMGDLDHEHCREWEGCLFYPLTKHKFIKRVGDVMPPTRNKLHPTQKPVVLVKKILQANRGQVVLDCYAGSGTTLVAAKMLGREAIGVEIEERYCEQIAHRLDKYRHGEGLLVGGSGR